MNLGKCSEEVLNRTEQARKATRALNSLLWSKYISVNTKTQIFSSDRKHFKLQLGNLDTILQVRVKTVKYRNGFLEKSCKDHQTTESKK